MPDDSMKELADRAVTSIEGIKRTGIRVLEVRERYAKMLMPLKGNVNHIGMMYAGSMFTIGEIPGGILYITSFDYKKYYPIVKEVTIRFVRPALTDVTLEAEISKERVDRIQSDAEENGKADFVLEMEIKDARGEVVAIVNGIWQIRKITEGIEMKLP